MVGGGIRGGAISQNHDTVPCFTPALGYHGGPKVGGSGVGKTKEGVKGGSGMKRSKKTVAGAVGEEGCQK